MDGKAAIVIDTNFIINHTSDLIEAYQKLSETYDVFISDISIRGRLSQKYLELKAKYEKIDSIKKEYAALARIEMNRSFDVQYEVEQSFTKKGYLDLFGNNIIPIEPNSKVLKTVMEQVYRKMPPLINADNASDKGFKDTLLSLLECFKIHACENAFFVTDDKGFRNQADVLCAEFQEVTGKNLEIVENSFYNELIRPLEPPKFVKLEPLPDVALLREQISQTISSLFLVENSDSWGNPTWENIFFLKSKVTPDDIDEAFRSLGEILDKNFLRDRCLRLPHFLL